MALAILKFPSGKQVGRYNFIIDIGSNKYFQLRIGDNKRLHQGIFFVDKISVITPLTRASKTLVTDFRSEFPFHLEPHLVKNSKYIQLFSYKNKQMVSPAVSDIVALQASVFDGEHFKLPAIMSMNQHNQHSDEEKVLNRKFDLDEATVSETLSWGKLLESLPTLLEKFLPLATEILPAITNALPIVDKLVNSQLPIKKNSIVPNTKTSPEIQANTRISPEIIQAILELIRNHKENKLSSAKTSSVQQAINPVVLMKLAPLLQRLFSAETIKAIGNDPLKLFRAITNSAAKFEKLHSSHAELNNPAMTKFPIQKNSSSTQLRGGIYSEAKIDPIITPSLIAIAIPALVAALPTLMPFLQKILSGRFSNATNLTHSPYSEAKVSPALLAVLPILIPIIKKVLTPEMIKTISNQPINFLNAITGSVLKFNKQEIEHLERLNPGVDDAAVDDLIKSFTLPIIQNLQFQYSDLLEVVFLPVETLNIKGQKKVVYSRNHTIRIPVQLRSEKQHESIISKGIFQLKIQDADTMEQLLEKRIKLTAIPINNDILDIELSTEESSRLPMSRDLKLEIYFIWPGKNGNKGTFKNHYIFITDGYVYKNIQGITEYNKALDDVIQHRSFWHKVWEGEVTTHKRWKIEVEWKYYYSLNNHNSNIYRLGTKKKIISDSHLNKTKNTTRRKIKARMKSGLDISLESHNNLLTEFSLSPLSLEKLNALRSDSFEREAGKFARTHITFRGKNEETVTLWVYPEITVYNITLEKVTKFDMNGLALSTEEVTVNFPQFTDAHFIGTISS